MKGIYCRKGRSITDFSDPDKPLVTTYKFINEAKRESRKLQLAKDGGLGRGCLYRA